MVRTAIHVDPAHPAFAGHFPGQPILPGVVLLDEVMGACEAVLAADNAAVQDTRSFVERYRLAVCKFHQPVGPDARLIIEIDRQPSGTIAFGVVQADQTAASAPIASGSFALKARSA